MIDQQKEQDGIWWKLRSPEHPRNDLPAGSPKTRSGSGTARQPLKLKLEDQRSSPKEGGNNLPWEDNERTDLEG